MGAEPGKDAGVQSNPASRDQLSEKHGASDRSEKEGLTMQDTFTYEDISKIVDIAIGKTLFSTDESRNDIARELDSAWTRGAKAMQSRVLLEVIAYKKEAAK